MGVRFELCKLGFQPESVEGCDPLRVLGVEGRGIAKTSFGALNLTIEDLL